MSVEFKLIPVDRANIKRRGKWIPILEAFLEQESDACLVEVDGYDAEIMALGIQGLIAQRDLKEKVKCSRRGDKVYLIKFLESD